MRRLGLVWRVALIVIAALVAIQMIAAAAYYVQRGRATEQGTVIDMRLTQRELAELAGMTRETMARTLREFQQAGCIRVEAGIISILEESMLQREVRLA